MDIICRLCGEPWDNYCQTDGTFDPENEGDVKRGRAGFKAFLKGGGCPACKWGQLRPSSPVQRTMAELLEDDAASEGDNDALTGLLGALERGDIVIGG